MRYVRIITGLFLLASVTLSPGLSIAQDAKKTDPAELVKTINQLAREIDELQQQWKAERIPAKKQMLWKEITQKTRTYNELLGQYQDMIKQLPSVSAEAEGSSEIPEEAKTMLQQIRQLETQIFQLQKDLNDAFNEYHSLPEDTPAPRRRALERLILRLKARKDGLIARREQLIKEFKEKFPDLKETNPSNTQKSEKTNELETEK